MDLGDRPLKIIELRESALESQRPPSWYNSEGQNVTSVWALDTLDDGGLIYFATGGKLPRPRGVLCCCGSSVGKEFQILLTEGMN